MQSLTNMEPELYALALEYLGEDADAAMLQGDGSDRKIYRLTPKAHRLASLIGVYHADLLENEAFIYVTKRMRTLGLPAPEVYAVSRDTSCYLTEDLGNATLADKVKEWSQADAQAQLLDAYKAVIDLMPRIQQDLPAIMGSFLAHRHMGHKSFVDDMIYFQDNFLDRFGFLDYFTSKVALELQQHMIEPLSDLESSFFVYRDFQARNIMWLEGKPHLIDYQSAMIGSRYYDLASLLYASKAGLNDAQREILLRYYFDLTQPEPTYADFEQNFYLFLLLRRLRSLGSYGYLGVAKLKPGFFESIPKTLAELMHLCRHKKAFYPFEHFYWMLLEIHGLWPQVQKRVQEELTQAAAGAAI